ncbi:translation initiation factor IF-3 [Candidatus Uhrbacteria bacterium CG10_big_fil_rev_8_21_14_0_10_50_16]|uniref:Translation initiation factor IF-3 n=1 Tax=Candidatus Uhrbacteria bacterium CG10_big_fil_rev_8_21_14_0_10_50_16 TaxID=1975039 RepID=A0A2H0RLC9_9BACT|nr:MAG: translation initiation factor IF-3 [Candidatus Uhrbacteria bacterium CG10_big_fil_rev_8_21_14_0_10_50_16]
MRIHRRRKRGQEAKKAVVPEYQANEQIQADQLFLISDQGEQIGLIDRSEAQRLAEEREVDLVIVSPKANPPVARLMNYGQFRYQKEKEARKQKAQSKQTEVKAVRLTARIGQHDLDVRMKRALEFLKRGDKLKLEMVLRGREKAYVDRGKEIMEQFIAQITSVHLLELQTIQEFKNTNGRLTIIVGLK